MEQSNPNKDTFFGKPLDPAKPFSGRKFLDQDAWEKEHREIAEIGKGLLPPKDYLRLPDEKTKRQWNELGFSATKVDKARRRFTDFIQKTALGNTTMGVNFIFALRAAESFLSLRNIEKRMKIADRNGFLPEVTEFLEWGQFAVSGPTILRIGGLSMKDIMGSQHLSLSVFFKHCMEAQILKRKLNHESVVEENKDIPFAVQFPNLSKENIQEAAGQILGLWNTGAFQDIFDGFIGLVENQNSIEKELGSTASAMIKRVDILKKRIYKAILDPTSLEFKELKKTVSDYLFSPDRETQLNAIFALGIGNIKEKDTVSESYRIAKKLSQLKDGNEDFYQGLEKLILVLLEESHLQQELLTKNDVVVFLDESEELGPEQIPTTEDLKKIVNLTFQRSQKNQYSVDALNIDWDWVSLVPAKEIRVEFDPATNKKFEITLHYQNEDGETFNFNLKVNTGKGEIDWPFIEDPNDPEMRKMRDAVMLVAKEILLDVQIQADLEWQEKQKVKNSKLQILKPLITNGKKQEPQAPYTPRKKEEKPERERVLTPIQEALESDLSTPAIEKVKRSILLPPAEEMQKMLNGISSENQTMILEKIGDFNEKGAGTFKALPGYAGEGRKIYELRTGDYRVLLIERASGNGNGNKVREFEIYKVGNRREIFKKRQKN